MINIIIDEGFKGLLPELDPETFKLLEENLIENGCRDALVLWEDILIDGHNRYEICVKHDIPFRTVNKDFASRENALIWIITTQISRRNMTPMQLSYYRGVHYHTDKKIITNVVGRNQYSEVEAHSEPQPKMKSTAERLANQYNVSRATIKRDAKAAEVIDAIGETSPEAKRKIISGEMNIDRKYLRGLASNPNEDLHAIAAEIYDGTFTKNKPDPQANDIEGNNGAATAVTTEAAAEAQALSVAIAEVGDCFSAGLLLVNRSVDIAELKAALRSGIDALEDLYRSM